VHHFILRQEHWISGFIIKITVPYCHLIKFHFSCCCLGIMTIEFLFLWMDNSFLKGINFWNQFFYSMNSYWLEIFLLVYWGAFVFLVAINNPKYYYNDNHNNPNNFDQNINDIIKRMIWRNLALILFTISRLAFWIGITVVIQFFHTPTNAFNNTSIIAAARLLSLNRWGIIKAILIHFTRIRALLPIGTHASIATSRITFPITFTRIIWKFHPEGANVLVWTVWLAAAPKFFLGTAIIVTLTLNFNVGVIH